MQLFLAMAESSPFRTASTSRLSGHRRLDSWKEIAGYLDRHVTTVRRWERLEGLPVHRHQHSALGSVYAFSHELDEWFSSRRIPGTSTTGTVECAPAAHGGLPPSPLVGVYAASSIPLLGREGEIRALSEAWGTSCGGAARQVFVTGDSGIGKTRLIFEFASRASQGATVLAGRCDRQALVPFAPFVDILQWIARACPAGTLKEHLAGVDGGVELAHLAPELARHLRARSRPISTTPDGRRYRMFEAYASLLRALSASGPVLLLVDDLQWADRDTALLMRHLIRSVADARLCLAAAYCEPELSHSPWLAELLSECRREPSATTLSLGGLDPSAVREFVAQWMHATPPASLVRSIQDHTLGNPFFVAEILRHAGDPATLARGESYGDPQWLRTLGLPGGIRELVERRLAWLSKTAQHLLMQAAVVGREFDLSIVEGLTDRPPDEVLEAMEAALAAQIVIEVTGRPGRFAFAHALIHETLYQRAPAARRVRLHHRVAEAIERRTETDHSALAELAHHLCLGAPFRDSGKAVEYAVRAAEQAESGLAVEKAVACYGMALGALEHALRDSDDTSQRSRLHERRGRSLFHAGQWAAAREDFQRALAGLGEHEDARRCELLVRVAEAAFWMMDVPGLRRYAGEAETLAERLGRQDLWADARAWLSSADVADGDVLGAVQSDRRTLARAGGIRSFGLARIPLTLYWAGQTTEALHQSAEAVRQARHSGDPAFLLYALQHRGLSLSGSGRYDEAIAAFDEARTFGRRCGALPLLARATSMSVAPLLSLGDFHAATLRALEARELAHRVAFEAPIVSAGIDLLLIGARSHDPGRSESLLPEITAAVERAAGWHAWKWRMRLAQARAELALARGDEHEALIASSQVVEQSRARQRPKYQALGLRTRAQARARIARGDARRDARLAADIARTIGDPGLLLDCLMVMIELDGTDALATELQQTVQGVLAHLSCEPLRGRFLTRVAERAPLHR